MPLQISYPPLRLPPRRLPPLRPVRDLYFVDLNANVLGRTFAVEAFFANFAVEPDDGLSVMSVLAAQLESELAFEPMPPLRRRKGVTNEFLEDGGDKNLSLTPPPLPVGTPDERRCFLDAGTLTKSNGRYGERTFEATLNDLRRLVGFSAVLDSSSTTRKTWRPASCEQ